MLTKRDKAIIADLNRFRVMDRDSISELHFANLKRPINATNSVLLRLLRDGHIQRSTHVQPYVYYGADLRIKRNSAKINHWLSILGVYKEMRKLGALESFRVEPKFGRKGVAEPDVFARFRKTDFFIEVQRTIYTEKQMREKIDRYIDLCRSDLLPKPFPHLLILSEYTYELKAAPFRVFQSQSFTEFVESLKPRPIKIAVT
ncbi:replication-relaxation family protein [Robertmurraya sp. DFI.2.37]|uniref:replication-relaxation family protein n=1 Tax=Robertmurraya sp. DFI.2.37 TaxID=3031819 RepID=UPI001CD953AC|nr:replication-relaxation family protein [Robertmurraya sp. DFI.2.37]MDF1507175.1 replication-relaxation family protein [Robertmurraya sp. DFI.2.37]